MKFSKLSMFLFLGASIAGAATLTVGPGGQYPHGMYGGVAPRRMAIRY